MSFHVTIWYLFSPIHSFSFPFALFIFLFTTSSPHSPPPHDFQFIQIQFDFITYSYFSAILLFPYITDSGCKINFFLLPFKVYNFTLFFFSFGTANLSVLLFSSPLNLYGFCATNYTWICIPLCHFLCFFLIGFHSLFITQLSECRQCLYHFKSISQSFIEFLCCVCVARLYMTVFLNPIPKPSGIITLNSFIFMEKPSVTSQHVVLIPLLLALMTS